MIHSMKLACAHALLLGVSMLYLAVPAKGLVAYDSLKSPTAMFEISVTSGKASSEDVEKYTTTLAVYPDQPSRAAISAHREQEFASYSASVEGESNTVEVKDVLRTGMDLSAAYNLNDNEVRVDMRVVTGKLEPISVDDKEKVTSAQLISRNYTLQFPYDELLSQPSVTRVTDDETVTVTVKKILGRTSE
ncbi:hypothetical protein [Thalassospira xiamenensis]|uniref:Uncharacterized protein n=1 Tax=Thalassospira xiamenensis TaxID=220697 RepID=A0A285TY82_9PROT|nr:hypothetical protein [Thalassospira xiamenensis]SOC30939.1 hypothetical protein SAMN05428964_11123 [Thalassospira xiamenensis]